MLVISVFILFIRLIGCSEVLVIRIPCNHGEIYTVSVNHSIEYILDYPSAEVPTRLYASLQSGDPNYPVLITARKRAGAETWQLPYTTDNVLLYQFERTLCEDYSKSSLELSACAGNDTATSGFSVHVGTTCATNLQLTVQATLASDWLLPFEVETPVSVSQLAPMVYRYSFSEEQRSVRVAFASEDDACALIAIVNFTCPIPQTTDSFGGIRMTMLKSAGVQLFSSSYPRGFLVVIMVYPSEEACVGQQAQPEVDWLYQRAVLGEKEEDEDIVRKSKQLSITVKASLTVAQYAIASVSTLAIFLLFYVMFIGLVCAQRVPAWAKLVAPRAKGLDVTSEENASSTLETSASPRRRRRDSNATFDSSDNSDTDEEDVTYVATRDFSIYQPNTNRDVTINPNIISTLDSHNVTNSEEVTSPANVTHSYVTNGEDVTSTNLTNSSNVTNGENVTNSSNVTNGEHLTSNPIPNSPVRNGDNNRSDVIVPTVHVTGVGVVNTEGVLVNGDGVVNAAAAAQNLQVPSSTPFGLPSRLYLSALSRRRERVLRARSDRYLTLLYTVAVFYSLPVLQFVAAFQLILNISGSLDICYYNFLCAHPAGQLSDFNHVFSNLGYLLLGALFLIQVRRRRQRRKKIPRGEEYGIPAHYGLLSSLGAGMMVVAVLSASYHVCPNRLNFQFDTAFMYVLSVVSMVKIYQARHPDVNARAHVTFGVLAVLIALVVWGVLGGGALFWALFTVIHLFTFMLLSLKIYYVGQFRLERTTIQQAARGLAQMPKFGVRPLYKPRLVMLLIANLVNWLFGLYGLWTQQADFASHLLQVLLGNTLMYMVFYLVMKLMHGERPRWYAWVFLAGAAISWAPALYFFVSGSSDWSTTAALSRHLNHECYVLKFYDSHDLWHMLSAVALYLSFNAMLTWDDGLAAVKRSEIAVF